MNNTFASFAFGCRVNEAEKVVLDRKLTESGLTYNSEHPDYFIINSCAVTQKAEHEVRQFISQTRKKFPQTKIILTGCSSSLWENNHIKIKDIDVLINNIDKQKIPEIIIKLSNKQTDSYQHVNMLTCEHDKFLNSGRLMVKIQDGCNRFCTYCIVPYLRGKPVTQKTNNIVNQINVYNGSVKEVILTAINTEYFGKDNQESLPTLLDAILTKTKVDRISFGSIHPWSITDEFINWYKKNADNPRFVHFFHIPIQSGSDKILKLMNRSYTSQDMLIKLNKLQKINPTALIGTDIIVGFPGETEIEFNQTYNFLNQSPISKFHVFRFSPRTGTKAAAMEKPESIIDSATKIKRSHLLINLGKQKYLNFVEKMIGKTYPGLTLIPKNDTQEILLDNQIPATLNDHLYDPGKIVKVTVVKSFNGRLIAKSII
jgi:threonylcarbamoyladenosine tRNA methylthiotransferase MtaB